MGLYAPLVRGVQTDQSERKPATSKKLITPANAMTLARPILAADMSRKLVTGQGSVWWEVAVMAATDAEGNVARFIDKHFPESGRGATVYGEKGDVLADSAALLTIAGSALIAPKVSKMGKLAVSTILGQETDKAIWFARSNKLHMAHTVNDENPDGIRLSFPVSDEGKEAMFEKFGGIFFATLTHDLSNPLLRHISGGLAMSHATAGSVRGEKVRQGYQNQLEDFLGSQQIADLPE